MGLGSAPLGNMFARVSEEDAHGALQGAWDAGCRIFDTAPFYGYGIAERRVGDFLRSKPRDEFLLSTKVGRLLVPRCGCEPTDTFFHSDLPFNPVFDYSRDAALRSHEDSLQRLGLDRIDILLIHDTGVAEHGERQPQAFAEAMQGAAQALIQLREEKAVGAIGMGMNEWEVCEAALEKVDFDTFLLAGRYTLLEQKSLASFLPLCSERGVRIMVGGAFNSGLLVAPDPAQATYNYAPAPPDLAERAVQLREVCSRHGSELPAAALQFPLAHEAVAAVMVGSRRKDESDKAARWMEADLPTALWEDLRAEGLIDAAAPVPGST